MEMIGSASEFFPAERVNCIQSELSGSSHERMGDHIPHQPPPDVTGGGADHTHHPPLGVTGDHAHTKLVLDLSEQVSSLSGELRQARDTIRRLEERDCYHGNSATNPFADDHCL